MKPYQKTPEDIRREENDLKTNAIMRWLQNQEAFKFNPGDILIKKNKVHKWGVSHDDTQDEWTIETTSSTVNAPKKYVYAFENKLGIGYIRQLKSNGDGYCGTLICVANFDPENTRFELDPDFVDHTLIGDGEFAYNQEYLSKKKFRQDAMEANKKLLVKTSSEKGLREWFLGLKVGDEFWFGTTFDELVAHKYRVYGIYKGKKPRLSTNVYRHDAANDFLEASEWREIELEQIEANNGANGLRKLYEIGAFYWKKVSMTKPHPMKDQLCGPPK